MQDAGKPVPGLLLYSPVYDTTVPPAGLTERRQTMKGWVYAPFRVETMMEAAIAPAKGNERMRVVDVTDPAQVVLYADPDIGAVNTFTHSLQLTVYGRDWRFDFFSGPAINPKGGFYDLSRDGKPLSLDNPARGIHASARLNVYRPPQAAQYLDESEGVQS